MKRRFWERTDKGGSSTPGSFDSRGRVSSLFFLALFFVVVVFLHGRRSQRRRRMERATLGKIPAIQFFETEFSTSGVWLAQKREFFLFFFLEHYIYIGCHPIVIEEYPCVFVKTHVYISRQMAEWYLFCESLDSWAALPSSVAKRWRLALLCEPFTIAKVISLLRVADDEASLWATVTLFYSVNTGAKWWSFPQKIQLSLRAKATESKREKNFFFLAWRR